MATSTTTSSGGKNLNANEIAGETAAVDLLNQQIAAYKAQMAQQNLTNQATAPLIPGQTAQLAEMQRQAEAAQGYASSLAPAQANALQKELAALNSGGEASPAQRDLINRVTQSQIDLGRSDIMAQSQDALNQLRDTLAPDRGLRPSDTPILDRGDLIGQAGVRSYNDLVTSMRGAGAQAMLDYPMKSAALTNDLFNSTTGFTTNRNDFAQQLAESAFQNRLRLTGQTSSQGLGLAGQGGAALPTISAGISSRGTGSQSTTSGLGSILGGGGILGGLGQVAGGVGGLISGIYGK